MVGNYIRVRAKQNELSNHIQKLKGRVYVSPQHGIGDDKDPFKKSQIESELQELLVKKNPNQGSSSLCGPAVFFYCLLKVNPNEYILFVWNLWYYGKAKINNWEIAPSVNSMKPKDLFNSRDEQRIGGVNWITLSSIRDSGNWVLDYSSVSQETAGMTHPWELEKWFEKAGFKHVKSFKLIITIENLLKLNEYVIQPNHFVISLIDSSIVNNQPFPLLTYPKHWIVWSGTLNNSTGQPINRNVKNEDHVSLSLFSWGNEAEQLQSYMTLHLLQIQHFYAIVVKY